MPAKKTIRKTTQEYLSIAEIREDCVIRKDGVLSAVVMVSSINFALKSAEEQDAIIQGYISFLNSIDFPLQIVIQSRKLNINPYLEKLRRLQKEQTNDLLRMQTGEYLDYVAELVKMGQIMTKKFYLVISYSVFTEKSQGFASRLMEAFAPARVVEIKQDLFLKRRKDLMLRVNNVISGLSSMSLNSVLLDTQSLIELYYNIYNPITAPNQPLPNLRELKVEK